MKVNNELKSARVYSMGLPGCAELSDRLNQDQHLYRGIHLTEPVHCGFTPNPATGELVTNLGGGNYHFCLRVDEKLLPRPVIDRKVEERIVELQKSYGEDWAPTKSERAELKESVVLGMITTADYRSRFIHAFYFQGPEHGRLFIAKTSNNDNKRLTTRLIRAVESIKTTTIHIDGLARGLNTLVKSELEDLDNRHLGEFNLGHRITLTDNNGAKVSVSGKELINHPDEVLTAMGQGMELVEVELSYGERDDVVFLINSDFTFKSLQFGAFDEPGEVDEDYPHCWKLYHGANLLLAEAVVASMCELMGYRPMDDVDADGLETLI
jgi:recombination associated protein RdgC